MGTERVHVEEQLAVSLQAQATIVEQVTTDDVLTIAQAVDQRGDHPAKEE